MLKDSHYIYLIQEREFIKTGENIYKIGKTTQQRTCRFREYPKGSVLMLHIQVKECHELEKKLIEIFTEKFILRKDIGAESFQGDPIEMKKILIDHTIHKEYYSKIDVALFLSIMILLTFYLYYTG